MDIEEDLDILLSMCSRFRCIQNGNFDYIQLKIHTPTETLLFDQEFVTVLQKKIYDGMIAKLYIYRCVVLLCVFQYFFCWEIH